MINHKQTTALHQLNPTYSVPSTHMTSMVREFNRELYILRVKQLVMRTGLSRATLYVLMSTDPTFPRKIKLTARTVGFLESEVDAWIAARADSRLAMQ